MKKTTPAILLMTIAIFTAAPLCGLGSKETVLESANFYALGTTCTVSIYDGTEEEFAEIESIVNGIESRMSVNIAESEISAVNASAGGAAVAVSPDVFEVITAGISFSEISGGAFDISIGPLVQLWGIGNGGEKVPAAADIDRALALVDYSRVEASGGRLFLPKEGMKLEPGGIAKGYAADATAAYIRKQGHGSALINFGGNVFALGTKADGSEWRIGVQNPDSSRGDYIGIASISDKAVVTSGKYERFFIGGDGLRYHHILSTENGYPVENGIAQVTIVTGDSMTADAMSTTIFSLGLETGKKLAERMVGVEAVIVMENSEVYTTSGLKESFKLTDGSFRLVE